MVKQKQYVVQGTVSTPAGLPLQGFTVRAFDQDPGGENLLGSPVITNAQGFYRITYTDEEFRIGVKQYEGPDLIVRVYQEDETLAETPPKRNAGGEETINVTVAVERMQKQYIVKGTVKDKTGCPVPDVLVQALRRYLRQQEPVGSGQTDEKGEYSISYTVPVTARRYVNLALKVFNRKGELLHQTGINHDVPKEVKIDARLPMVYPGLSQFERMVRTLEPLLEKELNFAELEQDEEHDDVSFLAGKTGLEAAKIARLGLSYRLSNHSKITPGFWYAVLAPGFYEASANLSLEEQFKNIRAALPSLDVPLVRKALKRAFRENVIPLADDQQTAGWIAAFLEYAARQVIDARDKDAETFVKQVLEEAGIKKAEQQLKFSKLFHQHRGFSPALAAELSKDESFLAPEIAEIETSFRLAELTGSDFSVVKAIKKEFAVHQPDAIGSLAKKSEEEWINIVDKNLKSGEMKAPFEISLPAGMQFQPAGLYGKQLARQFREAFPTSAFAGSLERDLHNGQKPAMKHAKKLKKFLDANPGFEILNTSIDNYFQSKDRSGLDAYKEDEDFRLELKAVQRVFKLAPSYEAANTLLADNLHSARKIYQVGESEFVRKYKDLPGFDEKNARITWNKAANTHAAVVTLVSELKDTENAGAISALRSGSEAVADFPNWKNLFRSGDICECEHCRSVLSPAAYFADLMTFLKYRKTNISEFFVKDILLKRRPDLGYIELNCENALTSIPYIDVVCEVLEDAAAAGENDLELPGLTTINPDMSQAKTDVQAAFQAQEISPGNDFTLSRIGSSDNWVLHHDEITYLLKKKSTANYFAEILRNTKASAAELRANPQYVNPKAYDKLKEAAYPFVLPFDLFNRQVRAGFRKAGLKRWELMQVSRGTTAPNNPEDSDIAAEYFGISNDPGAATDEKRMITQTNPDNQHEFWGEPDNPTMITQLTNVQTFLQKTGLEYNHLLTLLDLKFINPGGSLEIHHLDASCDTEQKEIRTLDEHILDRIHRFLRLRRKLADWNLWELDLVIGHPNIGGGNPDETFLIRLMHLVELKNKLGKASLEQLCALLGDINTETRFTGLHQKREDALYQDLFLNRKLIHPLDTAFEAAKVDVLSSAETIPGHQPVVIAALKIKESELSIYENLTRASDGTAYINDELTLGNLSFLYRHSWLAKQLKFKAAGWKTLLKLLNQDIAVFANPRAVIDFIEKVEALRRTGFSLDELNYLLSADPGAGAAVKEQDAARFLLALRQELQTITAEYDTAKYPFLEAVPPTDVEQLTTLLTSLLQTLNRSEETINSILETFRDTVFTSVPVQELPPGFDFPDSIKNTIPIQYDETNQIFRFTGLMLSSQQDTLKTDPGLTAVTDLPGYLAAVDELFWQPRLVLKFYLPVFTAPLHNLPGAIDFKQQLPGELSTKIAFDVEQRLLRFSGIMTREEKEALEALSADADYLDAVDTLFTQPKDGAFPVEELWIQDADLVFPLRDLEHPADDHLAQNLAAACRKLMAYIKRTQRENTLIQQLGTQLGLTPAVVRKLVTTYQLLPPDTILRHFIDTFAPSSGAVEYTGFKATFDTYQWLYRVSLILGKWEIELTELEWLLAYSTPTQTLDFNSLPLDSTGPLPLLDPLLRTSSLFTFRERVDESKITLLEVLEKLHTGAYPGNTDFANDVCLLKKWDALEVKKLTESLDLNYPDHYLLAENWERLSKAVNFLDQLNAGTDTVKAFANPGIGELEAKTLDQQLCSRFGAESWLTLSTEIQDELREYKRDALAAWLLTQPQPADAPSGEWENTNDVYAYYLLDVEMSSCMLTSRLVQASGSVQLFVQRCMMGLEPEVVVKTDGDDGDSAWHWWKWMRKYRVWEANRKVFLYPENWIEPELRRDKSSFFKDLENELLQSEVNQYTVETAFLNYLEKLDGVAHLEIAGFYHEDDADRTIIHVFGRSKGAEPHIYYYRQYDYRGWTPWEKVDLDITGDYLIPAVVNKRLFLFWPIFTEVPDEEGNKSVTTPSENSSADLPETMKRLKLQMAVSEYRNGKWMPKKLSKEAHESTAYAGEISKKHYIFWPIDRSGIDGRFGIKYQGNSIGRAGDEKAPLHGAFEIFGCKGVPEIASFPGQFYHCLVPDQVEEEPEFLKYVELKDRSDKPENDLSLKPHEFLISPDDPRISEYLAVILEQTPRFFSIAMPWHPCFMDRFFMDKPKYAFGKSLTTVGTWMPFFYADHHRTFFVLPTFSYKGARYYYPGIKHFFKTTKDTIEGYVRKLLEPFDPDSLSPDDRDLLEQFLGDYFNKPPSFTSEQIIELIVKFVMQYVNLYLGLLNLSKYNQRKFHFKNDYHPFVCDFTRQVYNPLKGIPGLMSRETQMKNTGFGFSGVYQPTHWVVKEDDEGTEEYYPREEVDFSPDGAYSPYNWELFFHAPLMIASRLSKDQRFEEAMQWFHYIFNPVGLEGTLPDGTPAGAPQKYWITKPFFLATDEEYKKQRIDSILRMLAGDTTTDGFTDALQKELQDQVKEWRDNPFEPHRIARYRTAAYQKTTVMKYLDNLIAWGDYLFRQDSMESINEATQLYILAAEILGPRPAKIPPRAKPAVETYNELEDQLDHFSNALVQIENLIPVLSGEGGEEGEDAAPLPMLYFCIPQNEKLLEYWDTVADRLYKIRHCMNIEGVVRQLSLFEPPIDPGVLVKAVAGGVDIGSVLADLNAPLPFYRFNVMLQKANEFCSDVKALGSALLSALEKKDAEAMNLLRQGQEIKLLEAVKAVKEKQVEEAKENLEGLKKSKDLAEIKQKYFENKEFMNAGEIAATVLNSASLATHTAGTIMDILAGVMYIIPDFNLGASGFGGTPHTTVKTGGKSIGDAVSKGTSALYNIAAILDKSAALSSTIASYQRRKEEWDFQEDLAVKEIEQIEKQIAAAELRIAIAEKEVDNHLLQIENAKATEDFLKSKYTNQELYQWMVGEISRVYFQSYQLAYDMAKKAEQCYRFELGPRESDYIQFGCWDSLKKGLLAGDRLQYHLRRLEAAYLEQNRREFELSKHISLALLDPLALVQLKETGRCFFRLPEEIFDLDYPGHYFRRIKSVSITLPCVIGPYTTISCTLRLLKNHIRIKTTIADGYRHNNEEGIWTGDERFVENNIPVKATAASNAQNDSGVFELNFRDERYLPFEGAGVISQWALELFHDLPSNNPDPDNPDFGKPLRQFDYSTISDAVIHVRYSAREDAGLFKNKAVEHLRDYFSDAAGTDNTPGIRMFSLRHEFPNQWHRFLNPENPSDGNVFQLELNDNHFSHKDTGHTLKVNSVMLLAKCTGTDAYDAVFSPPLPEPPPEDANRLTLTRSQTYGFLHAAERDTSGDNIKLDFETSETINQWRLEVISPTPGNLQPGEIEELIMILGYQWED